MSKHLQRDLENLQADLLALAASVEQAVHEAVTSLQDRDPELAQQVIDGDSKIDQEENHIEEECLKILALHQPVAVDLRRIDHDILVLASSYAVSDRGQVDSRDLDMRENSLQVN